MRIGFARVSTDDCGQDDYSGLAADPAVAIRINLVQSRCNRSILKIMWFRSHGMWFWESSYSQLIWFQNRGCCRFEAIRFSVRYT